MRGLLALTAREHISGRNQRVLLQQHITFNILRLQLSLKQLKAGSMFLCQNSVTALLSLDIGAHLVPLLL